MIRGEGRGLGARAARIGLSIAAGGYRAGAAVRNAAFDIGLRSSHRVGVPVVSVGNLTLGGTGKTPMVEWVARWFRERGLRVVIISRGYGSSAGLNDEGRVLEENLPDVPHLQGADRVVMAKTAIEELEAEALVLDDAFQHRRIVRDLDIVLLDALEPFGLGRMCPRGLLREPVKSLRRAGVVVLSRADAIGPNERAAIRGQAERQAGPLRWAEARHAPRDLIDSAEASHALDTLKGRRVAAFCGIGNPEGFRRTLAGLGVQPAGFRALPDHYNYQAGDLAELAQWARSLEADLALTTQKDLVKLRTLSLGPTQLLALRIGLEVTEGAELLENALRALLPAPG